MLIGITGRIGSGKSTVAKALAKSLNTNIVDADKVSRSLTEINGKAIPLIEKAFGKSFIQDGAMDRIKMRELVFNCQKSKEILEKILKPLIQNQMVIEINKIREGYEYVIIDIPLLVGSDFWLDLLNFVIVVDCPEEIQVERIQKRNNLEKEIILKMMASQHSRKEYRAIADYSFENLNIEDLEYNVKLCLIAIDKHKNKNN